MSDTHLNLICLQRNSIIHLSQQAFLSLDQHVIRNHNSPNKQQNMNKQAINYESESVKDSEEAMWVLKSHLMTA